jgi:hypothetical protein
VSLLGQITPIVLTFDEAPNIGRTLDSLSWAGDVVVVDSGSADETMAIAARHARVRTFVRPFDGYAGQWRFAFHDTGIRTPFVLALDADMAVSDALRAELEHLPDDVPWSAATLPFDYRIHGMSLGRSLLQPQLRLVRRMEAQLGEIGHRHLIECAGATVALQGALVHDDRKPLETFLRSQAKYTAQEWDRVAGEDATRLVDRVRRHGGLAGTVALCAYAAARIGLWAPSPARRRYWIERALCELMIAYRREQARLERGDRS